MGRKENRAKEEEQRDDGKRDVKEVEKGREMVGSNCERKE